jgi:hypothetical protein
MAEVIALDGFEIARNENLQDPKTIFEFIWSAFCLKAEKQDIPPVIFFIRQASIECFNFSPFTKDAVSKELLRQMVSERVQQEQDIEGVALCYEAFMVKRDPGPVATLASCPDSIDAILLSMDWRGVSNSFMRSAEKIRVDGTHKLINITDITGKGRLSGFFDEQTLPKERRDLQ